MAYKQENPYSRVNRAFLRFLAWREKHVKERAFVIFLSLLVGVFAGMAAIVLKMMIHLISGTLLSGVNPDSGNYAYIILPAVGVTLSALYVST